MNTPHANSSDTLGSRSQESGQDRCCSGSLAKGNIVRDDLIGSVCDSRLIKFRPIHWNVVARPPAPLYGKFRYGKPAANLHRRSKSDPKYAVTEYSPTGVLCTGHGVHQTVDCDWPDLGVYLNCCDILTLSTKYPGSWEPSAIWSSNANRTN